jgi:benzoyl-CoA reductase/2-hydroxyglutaryl-CoA dehydratase subunit BcrC/BadD/HgdB
MIGGAGAMNVARTYGNVVRRQIADKPKTASAMIRTGLYLESFRCAHFAEKKMPKAYRFLNSKAVGVVADALSHPETYAWTNIFAPTELLQTFGLSCVSVECLASYLSGFWLEDYFIDRAEAVGIASTLCSYHKNFIGAVESGVLPLPRLGVTTSVTCDGNIGTFRYMEQRFGVKNFILDIPQNWSPEAERYVVEQLRSLIQVLENATGKKYSEEALRETIHRENESKAHFSSALKKRISHSYPNTMTLVLFLLLATHLNIGSQWVLDFFRMLDEEIETYPPDTGKRLFWVHTTPYSQPTLQFYLNYNNKYSIVCDDFNLDYMEEMDETHPLEALARKMICNIYNGSFERKAQACVKYAKEFRCDAAVEFCHWGCKQSAGGAILLKEEMRKAGIPMLILHGDSVDRRNNHDGQIRTRFEAFLEMLNRGQEATE